MFLDYDKLLQRYPWICTKNLNCVISPDTDGFLCGLLFSHTLNWQITGYYDGKILAVKNGISPSECVFLDMEIYRSTVKSIGQHMVLYNKNAKPKNWDNFKNCIQPNNLRDFDGAHDFNRKYPFGTIHLVLGILQNKGLITTLPNSSTAPLLFADGLQSILLKYTENCLDWFNFLKVTDETHILYSLLCSHSLPFLQIMKEVNEFYRIRDSFNATQRFEEGKVQLVKTRRTGHNLIISNTDGKAINLIPFGKEYTIFPSERNRVEGFLNVLSEKTKWPYKEDQWAWTNLKVLRFSKKIESNMRVNTFNKIMERQKPLSIANTSNREFEFTAEGPDKFF